MYYLFSCLIPSSAEIGARAQGRLCPRKHWTRGYYSERPRGAGFRSVNPAERWCENPARALARALRGGARILREL